MKKCWSVVVCILVILSLACACSANKGLYGLWEDKEDKIYFQLREDGTGTLAISSATMEFSYERSDSKLTLIFESKSEYKAEYDYVLDGDKLTLKSENTELSLSRHVDESD